MGGGLIIINSASTLMEEVQRTISTLEKQQDEIISLVISGKHSKEFLNKETDKVMVKLETAKKKHTELSEGLNKSKSDISLLDELFFISKHEVLPYSR